MPISSLLRQPDNYKQGTYKKLRKKSLISAIQLSLANPNECNEADDHLSAFYTRQYNVDGALDISTKKFSLIGL